MSNEDKKPRYFGRALAITAVVAAVAGGAAVAFAQHAQHVLHGHGAAGHAEHVQVMLSAIGASDAQKAEFEAVLTPAFAELDVMHDAHSEAMRRLHELLGAPTVDPARIEALRVEQLSVIDVASQRFTTALAEAAAVLSPEQRAALVQAIALHSGG